MTSPLPDSVVNRQILEVMGRSTPDATVSVNGEATSRGPDGEFSLSIELGEGPNLVEIFVTDLAGGQEEAVLAVIYIP